uniref:Uncharacterized protein n=2 Tax=Timema TaxID=61471 RepID=A0A7R9NZ84_9NEOP|nr:unnamed protein product [Timema bartmani]CAD7461535.1 unnamed protein product [Timema tahoe]
MVIIARLAKVTEQVLRLTQQAQDLKEVETTANPLPRLASIRTAACELVQPQEIYKEKKHAAKQPTIHAFFQPVAAMVTHDGEKIMSDEPVPSTSQN